MTTAIRRQLEPLRTATAAPAPPDVAWRHQQLDGLLGFLDACSDQLVDALSADLGRPTFESWIADVRITAKDIEGLRKGVARWMRPERVRPPMELAATTTRVHRDPLGLVLVIAPWNYPVQLSILPAAAALAAGNRVVLKPSELTPTVSKVLAAELTRFVDPTALTVVEGGVDETQELLQERFDKIFYTGNGRVGRLVAAAAAEHLTPVTLELGGKSPVIVDRDADLKITAKRIVWAKFLNAGQTCVAPDYVLAHEAIHDELVERLAEEVARQRGADPKQGTDFGRIVNERHTERLQALIEAGGYGAIACGGQVDVAGRYVAPTVLARVERDAAVLDDEIFGPILPVVPVADVDEATAYVRAHDKPLALYVFTASKATADRVLATTTSGGACVNDAMSHLLAPNLPFGGVGASGYGAYHGRAGFEEFSHRRSVMSKPAWFEMPVMYPPYRPWKERVARKFF